MEPKEKQRIYAQTFVPNVERFDDNPNLIQLASKARDKTSMPDGNASKPALKYCPPKKSMSNFVPPLATRIIISPDIMTEKLQQEFVSERHFQKNGDNKLTTNTDTASKSDSARFSEDKLPSCTQDVKCDSHILPTRRTSSFSRPVSPYRNQREITSISACMYAPSSKPTEMKSHPAAVKPQIKDHMPSTELQGRNIPESSAEEAKKQMRFFRSQSEHPKLERNRGNQNLPVGIAVARQRQHTTPTKPRNMIKSGSPDLGRYHEHALNQEREVLLRENKELSNYTSRLQIGSTNPMLNHPNAMLRESWEREQAAYVSSLLQWQAQQAQSSLLGSGLQHPSMWFGGASPYHFPGTQAGSSLPSAQASTSGYPLLGSGLSGGFVIMPQYLQEASAASMMPSLAAMYRSAQASSANLTNPFHNLLSQRLDIQHPELQALQQQTMLQYGIPFPLHKNEGSLTDERRSALSSQFPSELHTPDGGRSSHSPYTRLDTSPMNIRRDATPSRPHSDRYQSSPMRSPPTRTPTFQFRTARGADTPPTVHAKSENIPLNMVKKRNDETEHLSKQRANSIIKPVSQILDLTSSPEDYSIVRSSVKTEKEIKNKNLTVINTNTPRLTSKEEDKPVLLTDFNLGPPTDKNLPSRVAVAPVEMQAVEPVSDIVNPHDVIIPENTLKYHKPHVSSGVELLTKAADIHLQNITANTQPTSKRKLSGKPTLHPPRLFEDTENTSDKISSCANNENKPEARTTPPEILQKETERVDITTLDPDVLDAVRGITLLSQSFSQQQQRKMDSAEAIVSASTEQSEFDTERYREPQPSMSDCNDDVQSMISFGSITDSTIMSGDCMSGNELKKQDTCEKYRLKRKLKKTISSKLKLGRDDGPIAGVTFKLDNMDAKEIDMKMRLAELQKRYKVKQKELAKVQRKNKREKHYSSGASTNAIPLTLTSSAVTPCPYASPKFKFGETTPLTASQPTPKNSTTSEASSDCAISQGMFSPKRKKSSDSDKHHTHRANIQDNAPEKNRSELFFVSKVMEIAKDFKDNDIEPASSGHQRIPSGSRKRKPEKPKRICLSTDETPTGPLVESSKKNLSTPVNIREDQQSTFPDKSEKKRKRKMKQAAKNIKLEYDDGPASSSWVFKSKSKSEKHEERMRKKSDIKKANSHKPPESPERTNLSDNNNKRKKSPSVSKEKLQIEPSAEPEMERINGPVTHQLELKEEDLVKGLQVLIPLEDKLLYLCQINPIQPPDIYEVTVEGERHRHRPIVMCLEQVLKEAVPDVKPRSAQELCEGSRVAAYWSHKMHCLYTGTIAFDDSDDEDEENKEGMIQVEFDDGDSSMIPLDDIRLLPGNYPVMQPDAPFMMNYNHRRRNTSDMSGRDATKSTQVRIKKNSNQGADKKEDKPRKKSKKLTSKLQKNALDLSAYDYTSTDDVDQPALMPRKRATSLKVDAKLSSKSSNAESSSSSVSSAEEDSDTVFSDSGDDTYEGDDGDARSGILPKYHKNRHNINNHSNELWAWHDKDVQKKAVKGKAKKIYHKSIRRGDEVISCGESAVFLSAGRLYLPYIGRIESMWESWGNNMVVRVRWFYHPEETKRGRLKSHGKHPLYKSSHIDENDVQTISHKCEVVSFKEYCRRMRNDEENVFYCAGTYDPATGQVIQEHTDKRKHQKS